MAGLIAIMAVATFASIMMAAPAAADPTFENVPEGFDLRCFPRSDPENREGNVGDTHDAQDQQNPHDDQLGFTKGNPHDECAAAQD